MRLVLPLATLICLTTAGLLCWQAVWGWPFFLLAGFILTLVCVDEVRGG